MKWVTWRCGGCGRTNYSRSPSLPPSPDVFDHCLSCDGSGDGSWKETRPPDMTVMAEESFWKCPACGVENEAPALRAGSSLETCAGCKRESGVLWIGTWDGPLGTFDV
jgi:hypothetical protein